MFGGLDLVGQVHRRRATIHVVHADGVPLCDLPMRIAADVQAVDAAPAMQRRLAELGIRVGVVITCTQRCAGGGRVVSIGNARLALDRAALRSIVVTTGAAH